MFVALDLETRLIDAGRLDPDVVCMSVCDDQFEPELFSHLEAEPVVAELLANPDVVIVGANIAYDFGCLLREYPQLRNAIFAAYRAGRVLDCQLAQRLVDISFGELDGTYNHHGVYVKHYYSLAALHERWGLGALAKEGTWRLRYGELRGMTVEQYPADAKKYALDDAAATLRVWMHQHEAYGYLLKDLAAQARAALALHLQSIKGIHTDERACREYLDEVKAEIERHKETLLKHGLLRSNGSRDTKKAQEFMTLACERAGIDPKLTEAGKICMDAEACRDVNDPVMKAYSAFVSAKNTVQRTEKLALGSGAVPLQTRYTVVLNNGRSSSSEPSAPMVGQNLQNVNAGSRMRHVFKARPGFVFCATDFSGAELHSFSQAELWLTGKSAMGAALNEERDLHCHLAAALLGCPYEEVMANKAIEKYARARKIAKAANFGFLGGMGAKRFREQTNKAAKKPADRISIEQAEELRAVWFDTWQTQAYFDHIQSVLQTSGGLATIEQFVSGRVRGKIGYTELANTFFSGLTADAFKAALWELTVECYTDESSALFGSYPLLAIHDEILSEVPVERAHEAAWRKTEVMLAAYNQYCPDFPVRAVPALSRYWFKKAELVTDDSGRLRCWEPQRDDKEFDVKDYLKSTLLGL